MCDGGQHHPDGTMPMAGETDREQSGAGAKALDQREEFGAVRSLTLKLADSGCTLTTTLADSPANDDGDKCPTTDGALPMHWGGLISRSGQTVSESSDSQDFDFSMCGVPTNSWNAGSGDGISPADDLFYKGQLLPLHSAKRLQMLQKLSSPNYTVDAPKPVESDASVPVAVSTSYQPNGAKHAACGDDGYLKSALVNSRSSSFHSQGSNNFWESDSPGELDTGDSSSSRDSSGSSQDACSGPAKQTLPKFQDRIAFARDGALFMSRDLMGNCTSPSERPQRGSWPKWKTLFGLKKFTAVKEAKLEEPRKDCDQVPLPGVNKTGDGACGSGMPGRAGRVDAHFSAEQKGGLEFHKKEALGFLEHGGGWFSFPVANVGFGSNRESMDPSESAGLKGRERFQRLFIIRKPSTVKSTETTGTTLRNRSSRVVDIDARSSFSGNLTVLSSLKQPSFSAIRPPPTAAGAFMKGSSSRENSFQETARRRTLPIHSLSGNLRAPSFARNSKLSADGGYSAGGRTIGKDASRYHSGELHRSPSSITEFQSAIQGAIAHCKQSQSRTRSNSEATTS